MQTGDLVVCFVQYRATPMSGTRAGTLHPSNRGGQAWSAYRVLTDSATAPNITLRMFSCRFNGTWSANPSWKVTDNLGASDATKTNALSAVMLVFRPSSSAQFWTPDLWQALDHVAAPGSPFTVTIPSRATIKASTVTIACWATADANTWGSLSGYGWSQSGLAAQYRNTTGSAQSMAIAYNIKSSAGATNSVSLNQAMLGGDAAITLTVTFAEVDLPSSGSGGSLSFVQSKSAQDAATSASVAATFAAAIGAGHGYIGYAYHEVASDDRPASVTDDLGGEATIIIAWGDQSFSHQGFLFYKPNAGGGQTITLNMDGNSSIKGIVVHEVAGNFKLDVDAIAADYHWTQDAFNPDTASPGSITPSQNGAYIFGAVHTPNFSETNLIFSNTWGTAREEVDLGGPNPNHASADTVQGTAGAIDPAMNITHGFDVVVAAAALIPAAARARHRLRPDLSVGRTATKTKTLDANTTYKTKYCIPLWLRDEQVRLAIERVPVTATSRKR